MSRKKTKEHTCEEANRDLLPVALDIPCEACEEDEKELSRVIKRYYTPTPNEKPEKKGGRFAEWQAQRRALMAANGLTEAHYWAAFALFVAILVGLVLFVVRLLIN